MLWLEPHALVASAPCVTMRTLGLLTPESSLGSCLVFPPACSLVDHHWQVHKGVIFRPRSDTVEIGRYLVPGTVVYTLNEPYAESYPHFLNVTYSLVSGNVDGTFGFLMKNSTVGRQTRPCACGMGLGRMIVLCLLGCASVVLRVMTHGIYRRVQHSVRFLKQLCLRSCFVVVADLHSGSDGSRANWIYPRPILADLPKLR